MKLKNLFLAAMTLFAFTACTDTPDAPYDFPNGEGGGTTEEGVYINETFASDFGVFSTVETVGETPWVIDYKTAKATSYIDGENKEAVSWLISEPVDFTNETEAHASFEYIIRYAESGKVAANHQLLISADYAGDAAAATWVDMPYGAVEGSDWTTFYKADVNVPADFMGKSGIVFALRYTAKSKAGTWEVRNFKVAHGTAEAPEEPEEAQEYTVAEAIAAFTGAAKPAVVKGYIVGTINGQVYEEGCVFSGEAESKTNLLIADSPEETDHTVCMPVQLPSGAVRNALNLVDNPDNYKKEVVLTGSLEKYFGVPGLKSVSKFVIDGVTPDEPETPADAYIYETFATSFGTFTTQETVGNYPWIIDYSTAKATSYDSETEENYPATSWLVSPTVDFTNETEAYIAFEYIIRYAEAGKVADNHQLLISADYTGDVATATWVNVPYGAVEGSDWNTFYKANVAVPAEFLGKGAVTFALRYTCTTKAGTWEVKNFTVAHGAATGETPDTPDEPTPDVPTGENLLANGSFEDWSGDAPTAWGGPIGHNATIAQSSDARTGSLSVIVNGNTSNKRLASKSYTLTAGTYTFSIYVKTNGAEEGHCRLGYVTIEGGAAKTYKYETPAASAATAEWTPRVYEFTLTETTELAFVVMNNKTGDGASFLVDDASLVTTDGSVIEGGNEGGEEGEEEEPETPADGEYLNETFASTLGSFTTKEVIGNYPWSVDSKYGHVKVSGYMDGASQDAESWLISPAMNLTGETAANIIFDFVINKGDASAAATNHKLLITSNYTGDVTTTEWTEIEYGAVNNNNWTFNNTGNIALPSSVMNKNAVVVAFKYTSTTANSSTWEVKNLVVSSATK